MLQFFLKIGHFDQKLGYGGREKEWVGWLESRKREEREKKKKHNNNNNNNSNNKIK